MSVTTDTRRIKDVCNSLKKCMLKIAKRRKVNGPKCFNLIKSAADIE